MKENEEINKTSISKSTSIEEIAEFWDKHSLDVFWDETKEADFEVRAIRRRRITLDPDIYSKILSFSRKKGLYPETLVNLWLREIVSKNTSKPGRVKT